MKQIKINGVDEIIYFEKSLHNMPVYIWENNNLNGFYLSLCVNYGSLHTTFSYKGQKYNVPKGIAHYMEHIKFNEKKGYTAHDYFDKLGSDINAFTTFEYTNYEVTAHDHIKENLSHLIKYVLTPYFTKSLITKERGIITEEIKMDKDNPYSKLFYRSLNNIFNKSHYKNLVSGDVSDIKSINLDSIKLIYEAFYHPENMFMVVCGNVNRFDTMQIINDELSKLKIENYIKPKLLVEKEPLKVVKNEDIYEDIVASPKAKISFKIPLSKFKGLDKPTIMIYTRILLNANFGNTSNFKEYLLENGMINSFGFSRNIFDDYLVVTFTYESNVYQAVKEKIVEKLKKLEIDSSYLKRIAKCNLADTIESFENKELVSYSIQDDIINYHEIINNVVDIFNNAKVNDLNKIAKILNTDNISSTIVIPKQ